MNPPPAIVALTPRGLSLARRLAAEFDGAAIHASDGLQDRDVTIERVVPHLRALFGSGVPIVGVCAAGILIRALAPALSDKTKEPPVLAVAEDGSAVVPLLGGHRGANRLAREIAEVLGVAAALTTASELSLGTALDEPPKGYTLAEGSDVKAVSAALLAGGPVNLVVEAGDAGWLKAAGIRHDPNAKERIILSDRTIVGVHDTVVLHPRTLALGVGGVRGAADGDLIELIETTLEREGLARRSIAGLFSLDLKLDEPAMHAAARHFGVPFRVFDTAALAAEAGRLASPSDAVEQAIGLKGVAEAAALAAAGRDGTLIVPKRASRAATCAVARSPAPIDAKRLGRRRGELAVIGIGPGAAAWRTPEADAVLAGADDVIGYSLYLDLLGHLIAGKARHDYALGEEAARAKAALGLAAKGRRVALVSSGDAGIYGMASLALETIAASDDATRRAARLRVVPGVSALLAAAARAGAPLGHDFCVLSLSDRLTPLAVIERRLQAAIDGDFVIALFNPAGKTRREPLMRALVRLRAARPGDCPVVVARELGRPDEHVTVTGLAALDADAVDMTTLLIVGSSASRLVKHGGNDYVLTPRGYEIVPAP
ncbi:MAG: precorrin-3B C(17)-methyltransferase [Alphaproteobacteria bacterium]